VIARLLLVGALLTLVACASHSPASSSGQEWDGEGVRFTAPPGWNLQGGGELPSSIQSSIGEYVTDYVVYVTNQQFTGCGPGAEFCPLIAQLQRGGVVVAWSAHHCVAHGCDLPAGDQILVGGRVAVRYRGPGFCEDLLATYEEVVVVTVTPQRVDRIVTCSRDPAPATTAALAAMFDSIQWRTP
jgi:hypothetical protein